MDAFERRIVAAACGAHLADQLVLATLPLLAVLAFGADTAQVGMLVAAQGAAWLALTLPGGVWVDRAGPGTVLRRSLSIAIVGCLAAWVAGWIGGAGALAAAAFVASAGTVLFVLASVPAIRAGLPAARWPVANARIELGRAAVTLSAPVVAGALAAHASAAWALLPAVAAAAFGLAQVRRLPVAAATATASATPPLQMGPAIVAGARFVVAHPVLRPIAACAVCFNLGFFALVAVWVPYALAVLRLDAVGVGLAQAGYGAGLLAGALAAPRLLARVVPRAVLIGGPACATAAALLLWLAPAPATGFVAQALVGFGPMLWQVLRTTIVQRATPPELLGRASATLQVAVYGVRPLGALSGGAIAHAWGLEVAMAAVAACFAASAAVMAVGRLGTRPQARPAAG